MLVGKQSELRNNAKELCLTFKNENGLKLDLVLRAYNDGVAYRYRFPEKSDNLFWVTAEASGFKLDTNGRAWIMPFSRPSIWGPAYESTIQMLLALELLRPVTRDGHSLCFSIPVECGF
jgi:hypothetical protein